jgi:hypothetical protein
MTIGPPNCVKIQTYNDVYFKHIVQSRCDNVILVSILNYNPCHLLLHCGSPIKKSDHIKPTYLHVFEG